MHKYSIKDVAKKFNITTNKLRFYENKGLIKPSRNPDNNYRYYNLDDISRIQTILLYRSLNLTIEDIEKLLNDYSYEKMIDHLYNLLEAINKQVHYYTSLRAIVQSAVDGRNNAEELMTSLYETVDVINKLRDVRENWVDKWNFDSMAESFDQSVSKAGHSSFSNLNVHRSYDALLALIESEVKKNLQPNEVILDIGVGTGNLLSKFINESTKLIGVDASKNMLKIAKSKNPNISFRIGDFLQLPVESNSVDYVISSYAFHHLNVKEKGFAFDEMLRVLKPIGRIIIGDLMFKNLEHRRACYKIFTDREIEVIEDEFYSYIDWFKDEAMKKGYRSSYQKLDEITYMVTIKL